MAEPRRIDPDKRKAESFVLMAKRDLETVFQMTQFKYYNNLVIRNIYECFRMLGEALLLSKGIKSSDHILPINELISFSEKSGRNLIILDTLRRLRHNINYYAYSAKQEEALEAIRIAKDNFNFLADKILISLK